MQNVLTNYTSAATSYSDYLRKEAQKFVQLVAKATSLPDLDDLKNLADDISPDSVSEAIDLASTVMEAAGDNPLVAKLKSDLEEAMGISFDGPLQGAQLLLAGNNSPVMKVATNIMSWPEEVTSFLGYCDVLQAYSKIIADNVNSMGGHLWEENSTSTIDPEVAEKLQAASRNLASSLIAPYNLSKYGLAMDQVVEAVDLLEAIPLFDGISTGSIQAMGMKMATQSLFEPVKRLFTSLKKSSETLKTKYSTIKNTDMTVSTSTSQTTQARKAQLKIKDVVKQLSLTDVNQTALIPQYIAVLNTSYNMLEYGRPTYSQPPEIFDRSALTLDTDKLDLVVSLATKLYQYTLKPYRMDVFTSFYSQYVDAVLDATTELAAATAAINDLWLQLPGIQELLEGITAVLNNMGLDAAVDILGEGDIGSFLALDDTTGTAAGMMMVAFDQISELGHSLNLYQLSSTIEGVREALKAETDKKVFEQKAKRNDKVAMLKKQLDSLNNTVDSATELISTVQGVLDAISSTVSQL